jgi:hypothetical protein
MIQVNAQAYGAIWAFVGILIGAGWAAFGIVGGENQIFLAIMVVITMVLGGGTAVLLRRRSTS